VVEEQEAYYFQYRIYSSTIDSLNPNPTAGNTITIQEASVTGWSATVVNPKTPKTCAVIVGSAAPIGTANRDGVMTCF
jgi:hypothetical protein